MFAKGTWLHGSVAEVMPIALQSFILVMTAVRGISIGHGHLFRACVFPSGAVLLGDLLGGVISPVRER